jgi:pilus assembly protein CpaE
MDSTTLGIVGALLVILIGGSIGLLLMRSGRRGRQGHEEQAPGGQQAKQGAKKSLLKEKSAAKDSSRPAPAKPPASKKAASVTPEPAPKKEAASKKPAPAAKVTPAESVQPTFSQTKPEIAPDTEGKIRILVVDDNTETSGHVERLLYFEDDIVVVGQAVNGREGVEKAIQTQPHIILMDINMPDMDGITATRHLSEQVPFSQVIMISVQSDPEYMKQAMLAGARDYQPKPFSVDELVASVRRVYGMSQPIYDQFSPDRPRQTAVDHPHHTTLQAGAKQGRVVALYSPKGGVGTSTIAANLAAVLQYSHGDVALMDADLQFGDIMVHYDVREKRSIFDMLQGDNFAVELLPEVLIKHQTGVNLLLSPPQPEVSELITGPMIEQTIAGLRKHFQTVLIDTAHLLSNQTLAVLDGADYILIVTNPELPSIKNVRLFLEVGQELNLSSKRIGLVINSANREGGIAAKQIEQALKLNSNYRLPHDLNIASNANSGKVITQQNSSPAFAQGLARLAQELVKELEQLVIVEEEEAVKVTA